MPLRVGLGRRVVTEWGALHAHVFSVLHDIRFNLLFAFCAGSRLSFLSHKQTGDTIQNDIVGEPCLSHTERVHLYLLSQLGSASVSPTAKRLLSSRSTQRIAWAALPVRDGSAAAALCRKCQGFCVSVRVKPHPGCASGSRKTESPDPMPSSTARSGADTSSTSPPPPQEHDGPP